MGSFGSGGARGSSRKRWHDRDLVECCPAIIAAGLTGEAVTVVIGDREQTISLVRQWIMGGRRVRSLLVCCECRRACRKLLLKGGAFQCQPAPAP